MITVLFQGDSITAGLRNRENKEDMGQWYAQRVAGDMELKYPGQYMFINRGVSGNRIVDVYARIKADIINLKPDIMTMMIGANDFAAEIKRQNGVPVEKYKRFYEMLLDEVEAALPNIKIILMGSYTVREEHKAGIAEYAEVTRKIAERRGYPYIPIQPLFDQAAARGVTHLTFDAAHPDYAGSELIKNALIEAIEKLR